MSFFSDLRPILFISAALPLIHALVMFFHWLTRKTFQGFGYWVIANACIGLSFIFIFLRNQIPDYLSILLSNALMIGGLILFYGGVRLFFEHKERVTAEIIIFSGFLLLQAYLTFIHPDVNARIILISIAITLSLALVSLSLLLYPPKPLRSLSWIMAAIALIPLILSIFRAGIIYYQNQPIDLMTDSTLGLVSFGAVCTLTIWNFLFLLLNHARLEQLQHSSQKYQELISNENLRKVAQLGLLDEISGNIAESMNEAEILQRTVTAAVKRFGYAEAAITMLVEKNYLEVAAIDGSESMGFYVGYRQNVGVGIIGHVAQTKEVYISDNIASDPYYFTFGNRKGSAVGVPMLSEGHLLGVMYVESTAEKAFNPDDIQMLVTLVRHTVTAVQKARLYARSQANLRTISTLVLVSQSILSSLDLKQVFQSLAQLLKETYHYRYVSIYTPRGEYLHLEAQVGYTVNFEYTEIPFNEGIVGRTARTRQTQFIRNVDTEPTFLRAAEDVESEICIPFIKDDELLGVLNVEAAPGHALGEDDLTLLTALVGPVMIAIENARLHNEVKQLALTDGLTNVANRRAFDQLLEKEIIRAQRYSTPLSLILLDMDSFKQFNDQHGHLAGDKRLQAVAELLKVNLRSPDFIARYGGEEFVVILPNTTKSNALALAERLRAEGEKNAPFIPDGGGPIPGFTFSLGLATFPDDGETAAQLLHSADLAELQAKKLGKNRVCVFDTFPYAGEVNK